MCVASVARTLSRLSLSRLARRRRRRTSLRQQGGSLQTRGGPAQSSNCVIIHRYALVSAACAREGAGRNARGMSRAAIAGLHATGPPAAPQHSPIELPPATHYRARHPQNYSATGRRLTWDASRGRTHLRACRLPSAQHRAPRRLPAFAAETTRWALATQLSHQPGPRRTARAVEPEGRGRRAPRRRRLQKTSSSRSGSGNSSSGGSGRRDGGGSLGLQHLSLHQAGAI